jgi:hypothetical protein
MEIDTIGFVNRPQGKQWNVTQKILVFVQQYSCSFENFKNQTDEQTKQ